MKILDRGLITFLSLISSIVFSNSTEEHELSIVDAGVNNRGGLYFSTASPLKGDRTIVITRSSFLGNLRIIEYGNQDGKKRKIKLSKYSLPDSMSILESFDETGKIYKVIIVTSEGETIEIERKGADLTPKKWTIEK